MAFAQESPSETTTLEKHLMCTICMDLFVDPVTTSCGHSFCQECLDCNFRYNDRMCPLCKQDLSKTPDVNIILRTIVEQIKKKNPEEYTGAAGEVACDICTERKLKAKKSCLVCLASYCLNHLQNHFTSKRLAGHRLVEPVENLDERACLQHGRPLELYNRNKEMCICVLCMKEDQEEVVPTEEEWEQKKVKLDTTKAELQEKIQKRKMLKDVINASLKSCQDQLNDDWGDIDAVFTAVINTVKEAHAEALQPLKDRRQVLEKDAKDIEENLDAEICQLEMTISELDDIAALEDHILFLQSYPSLQELENIKDCPEVELDTSLSFGTMRRTTATMLESVQQQLEKLSTTELHRIQTLNVDVTLDPATAHKHLILTEDGKEVKDGGEDQDVTDCPERFDIFGSVLGRDGLTSGKSYWEVEVRNKTGWDLGVTRGDAKRRGKLSLSPDNGYWVVVHYEGEKYAALTDPPVRLFLKEKPVKVGVFVDYEEGLVSFYDVTLKSHIYSFTGCSFDDKIFPYLSPHVKQGDKNTDPLVVSSVKKRAQDMDLS